ncbi:MAG: lysozyme inhibitor LprI family protein [Candidatus Sulfotelmatobacter sp.]
MRPRLQLLLEARTVPLRFAAVVLFFASLHPAFAQNSAAYGACNQKAKTQAEMNACANEETARVDAELNAIYRKVLSEASTQPEAIAKIKAAERAWITYRDAYMAAMYPAKDKQVEYGSIYPMEADLLRARLTKQHLVDLRQLLQQHVSGAER